MLDNLYDNIGKKIKDLAKGIFIIEAIGAIITGFVFFCIDEEFILYGLLILVFGPIVAWVGSWILYAFGELVEKTSDSENVARLILKKLNENDIILETESKQPESKTTILREPVAPKSNERPIENAKKPNNKATYSTTEKETIICSQCNTEQPRNRSVCWNCGVKFVKEQSANEMPCPECGEDLSFMGWDKSELKEKQTCPLCGKEILIEK